MMLEKSDPRHLLIQVAKTLDTLGIPYCVTGGMAVLIWGRPRFTADIDIVVELEERNIADLENALKDFGEAGYVDREMMEDALAKRGEFNFIDGNTGMKVDFWVMGEDAFSRSKMQRRVPKEFAGETIYMVSPEDLILAKFQWYQISPASTRHLEDVESIFKVSGSQLDRKYLEEWAEKLGVSDLLSQFLK